MHRCFFCMVTFLEYGNNNMCCNTCFVFKFEYCIATVFNNSITTLYHMDVVVLKLTTCIEILFSIAIAFMHCIHDVAWLYCNSVIYFLLSVCIARFAAYCICNCVLRLCVDISIIDCLCCNNVFVLLTYLYCVNIVVLVSCNYS